ncbi:hypothetical protein LTR56_018729 [Elasticomyces elasticus]|nr:hypothetical protein LTR56_018729 [Elasticomyces elasticus]KAK3635956.1 hypothetical protein LTR22_018949 [Elasticomyces elasticus]KAK4911955.1 hypothetical protein LTR49_019517 [Elasticomyces elasticus]KAK5751491.1 hypothetical protein LTS12_018414 [Elasticomyces elasticus]
MPYWSLPNPSDVLTNRMELLATLRCYPKVEWSSLKHKSIQDLAALLGRLQAGLLLVGHLHMIKIRNLLSQEQRARVRGGMGVSRQYIALMDQDTRDRTFHRFLDLPPELRQRIYNYTFSYSDNAYHLQQPAIARVCRLLRTESLPVFYKNNRFGIMVERTPYPSQGVMLRRQALADVWPTYILLEHVAMMRYFEITLKCTVDPTCRLRVKIDLPSLKGDVPLLIQVWSVSPESMAEHLRQAQFQVEQKLRPLIESLLKGRSEARFTLREIQTMALFGGRDSLMLTKATGGALTWMV